MSILLALVVEYLAKTWIEYLLARRRKASPAAIEADNDDDEPMLDFDEVRNDVERIEDLLYRGLADEAHEECVTLIDRMHGCDEAARTDERWSDYQQQRRAVA